MVGAISGGEAEGTVEETLDDEGLDMSVLFVSSGGDRAGCARIVGGETSEGCVVSKVK